MKTITLTIENREVAKSLLATLTDLRHKLWNELEDRRQSINLLDVTIICLKDYTLEEPHKGQ
jgi:hypothetical protein